MSSSLDDVSLSDVEEADGILTPDDIYVEAKIVDEEETPTGRVRAPKRLRAGYQPPAITAGSASPKSTMPSLDEWMDFFSRVLLRTATDFYIDWAFRGIDENTLTERDIERIKMTDEERDRIARPFSEFAYKNKFTRKHGREIIATAGSIDAILQLGLWYSRVSRIAAKYKGPKNRNAKQRQHQAPVTPVVKIEPEEVTSERTGPGPQSSNGTRFKPPVNGAVWNPGG